MPDLSKLLLSGGELDERLKKNMTNIFEGIANERVAKNIVDEEQIKFLCKADVKYLSSKFNATISDEKSSGKFVIKGLKKEVDKLVEYIKYQTDNIFRAKDSKPETFTLLNEIFEHAKIKFHVKIFQKDFLNFEIEGYNNLEAKRYIKDVLKFVKKSSFPSTWILRANHYDLDKNLQTF
jgi:hypothetical protein